MVGFENHRQLSVIMGGGEINLNDDFLGNSSSSSDDEGGDEAEKFKNTFLKNKNNPR